MILTYDISDIRPFINWIYFDYAWSMNGKQGEERDRLHADANAMLDSWQGRWHSHAVFDIFDANSDGDDIIVDNRIRLPMLRQQKPNHQGAPNYCLADFIRPLSSGIKDRIGAFATSVDFGLTKGYDDDVYNKMLSQVLADRLAEGTAELMHSQVRRKYWGYAPDEALSMADIHAEHYQGIRPAVGYPSMPDTSMNFLLDQLIDMKGIGIRLTPSGMMQPHASVSGLMFAHPKAKYFDLGKIGEDQLRDYARRRGLPLEVMRKFLAYRLQ
jgi:cobalamin-dependent methionine synthase I